MGVVQSIVDRLWKLLKQMLWPTRDGSKSGVTFLVDRRDVFAQDVDGVEKMRPCWITRFRRGPCDKRIQIDPVRGCHQVPPVMRFDPVGDIINELAQLKCVLLQRCQLHFGMICANLHGLLRGQHGLFQIGFGKGYFLCIPLCSVPEQYSRDAVGRENVASKSKKPVGHVADGS